MEVGKGFIPEPDAMQLKRKIKAMIPGIMALISTNRIAL